MTIDNNQAENGHVGRSRSLGASRHGAVDHFNLSPGQRDVADEILSALTFDPASRTAKRGRPRAKPPRVKLPEVKPIPAAPSDIEEATSVPEKVVSPDPVQAAPARSVQAASSTSVATPADVGESENAVAAIATSDAAPAPLTEAPQLPENLRLPPAPELPDVLKAPVVQPAAAPSAPATLEPETEPAPAAQSTQPEAPVASSPSSAPVGSAQPASPQAQSAPASSWRLSTAPLPQPAPVAAPQPTQTVVVERVLVPVPSVDPAAESRKQMIMILMLALAIVIVLAAVAFEILYLTPLVNHNAGSAPAPAAVLHHIKH